MPPVKQCPECGSKVTIKKSVCVCGHSFKRNPPVYTTRKSKRVAMQQKRALETEEQSLQRKQADRAYQSNKRAMETHDETLYRLEQKQAYTANKRASETSPEILCRQEQNRACMAKKRASETLIEIAQRKEQIRVCMAKKRASETPIETAQRQELNQARMTKKRASETPVETAQRQELNQARMAKKRASETPVETAQRRELNQARMAKKRASETPVETAQRQELNQARMAKKRASETSVETAQRREQNRVYKAKKRALPVSMEKCIADFQSKVKQGPEFVCTCCHRMMYKQTVVPYNRSKYYKASNELLEQVFSAEHSYTSSDGKQWVCVTCDGALKRGNMPLQAKANGLQLCPIPTQLSGLNLLELRLLSLRIPFMKMVALPSGKQRCIHGPAVNVPSKVDTICTVLPRLPSQTELIPLKLKRKLAYRGHYMYDYISPEKVSTALRWLKENNPLYADIDINDEWLEQAMANDNELFAGMVEQSDTDDMNSDANNMNSEPTQEPVSEHNANCTDNDHVSTNQPVDGDGTQSMECCSSSIPSIDDVVTTAFYVLERVARENGFAIHDVPYDGDCLFSSIAYQLESIVASSVDNSTLRQMVADHLENNSNLYKRFLSQPVPSNDAYNADTEPPTTQDAYIETVADHELQIELRWAKYLQRLRDGAWGDHIAIQSICDMFNVTVNVLSSQNPTMIPILPRSYTKYNSQGEVYVGLIMQYHYVGLDQMPIDVQRSDSTVANLVETTCTTDNSPEDGQASTTENPLDDAAIEHGDEHTIQITGGPQASMMSLEHPEAIVSVAPAEGQKPLSIMTDPNFEAMFNPDKFCLGSGTFSTERSRKLTYRKYFNQRLLDVDGRFARDLDYLFVAQYIVEAKQVLDDGNNFIWRQKPTRHLTASQAKDQALLSQSVRKDKAYRFMKNVRGSPPYYQRTFYDLLAMIRQLGTPTWFFTLSAADLKWPDMIQTIAKQYGVHYTDEEIAALSFEDRSNWLKRNPVTAARHFQYRLNTFFHDFLKSNAHPLGEIVDYGIRIEFQNRGSPHAHCVIWIKQAPKYNVDDDDDVCAFIDQYISCAIPSEEGKLKELVELLQQHKHSSYCKRHNSCRFSFPKPPSPKTLIAQPQSDPDVVKQAQTVLAKVHKVLADGHTDKSLDEVLVQANITLDEYTEALEVSNKGSVVLLKREPSECMVNNYNGPVMLAWQANMDLQYVLNAYACIMYVASYIMKTDRAMGVLLKHVASEARAEELKSQMRKVGSAFLTHREVSAQEAVYRLLSLQMKQLSRSVVFVDTNPKNERIAVLKDKNTLDELDDDDTNVFQKSLIDRYQHRPRELQSMCLAEFAATYVANYKHSDDSECDALPASDSETMSTQIKLTDGYGKMNKRKREAVIRFRRYNKDAEPSNWYRAKLMLYYPWYDEQADLLGGYSTYEEHYRHVDSTVLANESKYSQADVDDVDIDESDPPEHLWSHIAPSTEESRSRSLAEGSELLTEVSQEDLRDNANLMTSTTTASLHVRFESATNRQEIPPEQYRQLLRELNAKQREIVMFHRNWCKKAIIALKEGKPVEPYRVFLSGPGGVGKSHVIKLIYSDTLKFLRLSGAIEPDDVIVLLTAPTGVAAFNINGMTLHSAFLLGSGKYTGFQPLSHDRLNTLRSKLSKLTLVIIDEVSMVGSNMLLEIHKRLQQIKGVSDDVTFGGVSILAVGDLYQLPPVAQPPLFSTVSDCYAQLYRSGSLWVDEFQLIELDEIMRQRGDSTFAELLCRVRTNDCTPEDLDTLKSRVITADSPNYPTHVLHVYRLNNYVNDRNRLMLNSLAPECEQYSIKASDAVAGQTTHIDLQNLSENRNETGGLHGTLKLAVEARVMLVANIDVSDGLVNGARGVVVHIVTNDNHMVTSVLVKFDNHQVGVKAIQTSPYRASFPNAVPLGKHEVVFRAKRKRGSEITRLQFPLTLAWATTIHKVQGLTLDEIVVDMKGGRFSPGQAYVAFSRVKTLQGLHILNFNASAIKKSNDVHSEMLRLNAKLLPAMPEVDHLDNHVTISLLNVRSVAAKLPDIANDNSLKYANILCFCETWLTSSEPSPIVQDNQIAIRCDRTSGDNKGGVMISIPEDMQPTHTCRYTSNGIEAVSTTLLLADNTQIQIALLYRSPSIPLQALTSLLSRVLNHVSVSSLPCIVLGDFNEDILHQTSPRIVSFMSSHGYTQLVNSPTTARSTLIDHVYCNSLPGNTIVQVQDTYYSDHDTVYCSIPLTIA